MRAVVYDRFGGPEVLEEREVPRPEPGPGEVLVRVMAAAVNPVDAKVRADGGWAHPPLPAIPGSDAAGIVEAVGPGVSDVKAGDEVYYTAEIHGNARGTYAEFHVVPAAITAPKPRNLSFVEAAAVPLAGGTAWDAVVRRLRVGPGEDLLIQGGAGGVGSFAVQFAAVAGARVIATAGPENVETLRGLGADVAIDYRARDPVEATLAETGGRGADAVFDIPPGNTVSRSLPAVRSFGRVACILPPRGDLTALYRRNITLHGVFLVRERARLLEMSRLIERGRVRPLVGAVLPLGGAREAHLRMDSGHGRGKVVLAIGAA